MSDKPLFRDDLTTKRPTPATRQGTPRSSSPSELDTELDPYSAISFYLERIYHSAESINFFIETGFSETTGAFKRISHWGHFYWKAEELFQSIKALKILINVMHHHDKEDYTVLEAKKALSIFICAFASSMGLDTTLASEAALIEELKDIIARVGLEQYKKISASVIEIAENSEKTRPISLPDKAPELYKMRPDTSETAPAFVKRVYGSHLDNGLTRAVIDKLDHPLAARLDALKRKNDPEALALNLPTAWAAPQKWAERVLAGEEKPPEIADVKTHTRNRMRIAKARERAAKER